LKEEFLGIFMLFELAFEGYFATHVARGVYNTFMATFVAVLAWRATNTLLHY
jgi:hypothetical protein